MSDVDDRDAALARIAELANDPRHHDANWERPSGGQGPGGGAERDRAMAALDRMYESDRIDGPSGQRLADLIAADSIGIESAFLAAVSSEDYERAFPKLIFGSGQSGTLTPREAEAVERVARTAATRDLMAGTPEKGGYAIPPSIDPSVVISSDSSVSPLRAISSVRTISVSEHRALTSQGVAASFSGEGEEVGEGEVTFQQPIIVPERATAYLEATYELLEDWSSARSEIARLFRDAVIQLENTKFTDGLGHEEHEPEGVLSGATEIVTTEAEGALAVDDVIATFEALPPRFQPGARSMTSLAIANTLDRLTEPAKEKPLFNDAGDRLLKKPWLENSVMSAEVKSEEKVLILGDFENYRIVDRVGARIEVVQQVLGKEHLRPVGARGLLLYWRTSAGVLVPNAFRTLEVK